MTDAKVTVYGAYWCPDCRRSKKFLGEQFIPFRWVDIEQDKEGEAYVLKRNNGKRIIHQQSGKGASSEEDGKYKQFQGP